MTEFCQQLPKHLSPAVCVCVRLSQTDTMCVCVLSQQYIDTEHFLLFLGFTGFYLGPPLMMLFLELYF